MMKKYAYMIPLLALMLCAACEQELPDTMGSIYGIVSDVDNGEPIRGASVVLSPSNHTTVTGADGHYEFLNLEASQYKIQVTASGYVTNSRQITVKPGVNASGDIMLRPSTGQMIPSVEVLDFGAATVSIPFDIVCQGDKLVEWSLKEDASWLSCSPQSGKATNASSSVVATVSRDELAEGRYETIIIISAKDDKVADKTISVTMTVSHDRLQVSPTELDFGSAQTTLPLTLAVNGNAAVRYTVTSSNEWLVTSKSSGTVSTTDKLDVMVSRAGLAPSTYSGALTFAFDGGEVTVPVKMSVKEETAPTVRLESKAEGVTHNRATLRGMIADVGSSKIIRYGFCWAESPAPTIDAHAVNLGDCSAPKSFESAITGLTPNTTYYVRAYAENNAGMVYSYEEVSFTTYDVPELPTVTTGQVSAVTNSSAVVEGCIVNLGNVPSVSAYGHVWSTSANPTIERDYYTDFGATDEVKTFASELTDLEERTTYYVRAYVTNEMGTAYGQTVTFTTDRTKVENVTNGLYVYYTFESNTKNVVEGGYNATAVNNPSYVAGVNGTKAIKFSSSANSHITVPEAMIDEAIYSVSFWVKGMADGHIFHVPSSGQYDTSFDFIMKDGSFAYTTSGYTLAYQPNNMKKFTHPALSSSEWTMVTLTSTIATGTGNTTVKLYLNGEFVDVINEENAAWSTKGYGTKIIFGGKMSYYNISLSSPSMTIDNLRVYNTRVLSAQEVMQIYNYELQ
ncbi:MAG: carboxypeptidase regulatory-like domain-containing protein [Bacteroidaceae bacterium]|nr:carboxypeptidase regulatory-like domain-containing protein [Bacteroidaceae bacterium]